MKNFKPIPSMSFKCSELNSILSGLYLLKVVLNKKIVVKTKTIIGANMNTNEIENKLATPKNDNSKMPNKEMILPKNGNKLLNAVFCIASNTMLIFLVNN